MIVYVCHELMTLNFVIDVQEEDLIRLGNLRSFTFKELQLATDNFSSKNILGAGGFGNVYRGKLGDGTFVAVKRLKDVTGTAGESQFRTELELISLAVHRNLLRLIGYCAISSERLLVYPYMSNGSVASRLRGLYINRTLCKFIVTSPCQSYDFFCVTFSSMHDIQTFVVFHLFGPLNYWGPGILVDDVESDRCRLETGTMCNCSWYHFSFIMICCLQITVLAVQFCFLAFKKLVAIIWKCEGTLLSLGYVKYDLCACCWVICNMAWFKILHWCFATSRDIVLIVLELSICG